VPYAASSKGSSPGSDPWVFLLIAPAQLLFLVFTTAGIFGDGAARDRIPALLRERLTRPPQPGWPNDQPLPGAVTELLQSIYWAFLGAMFAFVGMTVQVAMTATLLLHPEQLWPSDVVIVGAESLLAAAWIVFLARAVLGARRRAPVAEV
jgi:hypothetical protein